MGAKIAWMKLRASSFAMNGSKRIAVYSMPAVRSIILYNDVMCTIITMKECALKFLCTFI